MKNLPLYLIYALIFISFSCKDRDGDDGCRENNDSDSKQRKQQEVLLAEGTAQVGMPAIKNFRERKLLKDILELRDQDGLVTYTYLVAEQTGQLVFLCNSIGYPLPAATQFTSPSKPDYGNHGNFAMPNADPNGLFSPQSAEGSWVLCSDPDGGAARVVYTEPRVVTSPFPLSAVPPSKDAKVPVEKP